jgi:hypothetical protein
MLVESGFYHACTPYMMGRLLKLFPKLNIAAVSLGEYPDGLLPHAKFVLDKYCKNSIINI